ncbi:hypothetical protein GpartN1_g215.t1 [Galdieria partita]|uniref:Uncharacterized protein n=1 Tax=Galdieria partita TaxID=83374 RepID=A0A9C7UMA6_9RHOD|nr:hypothetical protein GpartN1_g215.t1 [Galdieria partita]
MEQNQALRRPFKQPRKIAEPTDKCFKNESGIATPTYRGIIGRHYVASRVSCVEVACPRITAGTGRYPAAKQKVKQEHFCGAATSYQSGEGICLDCIEDESYSLPVDALDDSSLWEEEWLGDADDFELFDIIAFQTAKESAA